MDAVVDRYFPIIDTLVSELDTIEGQIFIRRHGVRNIEHLYDLKRRIMVVKHA
jgi:magnesium transporter